MPEASRSAALFNFIVTCLAQAEGLSQRDIGRLLGGKTAQEARRRFLSLQEGRTKTVMELVDILAGLRRSLQEGYRNELGEVQHPARLISAEHIYLALQKLIALTPGEKEALGLPADDSEILLRQAIFNMGLYQSPGDEDGYLTIYRHSTSLRQSSRYPVTEQGYQAMLNQWIQETADNYQKDQLGYPAGAAVKAPMDELEAVKKVSREINRILLKTGTGQLKLSGIDSRDDYIKKYFPHSFIKRLTQSVIENELLTEEFPVFIESVAVERCSPLPLPVADSFQDSGVLCRDLLNFDRTSATAPDYAELASYTVNKVSLQLFMRLPKDAEQSLSIFTAPQLLREGRRGKELHFEVSSTGIGGTFSHIARVLNHTLLYDIACLRDYFPIAHEIMMEQDIIGSGAPAPVVAHSLAKLCKVEALSQAMKASQKSGKIQPYEKFAFDDPVGRGDFCGFDTLTSVAKAALQARLRAIKFTGKPPQDYIRDLQKCVDNSFLLEKGCGYLSGYPFSSLAKKSFLEAAFGDEWNRVLNLEEPLIYFKIQLELVESFLIEDLHEVAKPYLDNLAEALERVSNLEENWCEHFGNEGDFYESFQVFPGTLLVRYELCQATYHYLTNAPEEAWQRLQRAEDHVNVRLMKYSTIDEVSQATFHPHYQLLAQIYFLRARLLSFFPFTPPLLKGNQRYRLATDVEHRSDLRTERAVHVGRLYLYEKARLYAACDGDSELYACLTAHQCCAYLVVAELSDRPIQNFGPHNFTLTPEQAKDWARRLRNEALLSYAETGRCYYYQIKEKSGIYERRHHDFGNFKIDAVPAIREQLGQEELGVIEFEGKDAQLLEKILYIDMSVLGLDELSVRGVKKDERGDTIYLFGSNACYLFFARGMYHLCSNELEEFREDQLVKSLEDWDAKLAHAYRLFSYAWAIADNGGDVVIDESGAFQIKRPFKVPEHIAEFEKDAASMRDLYPYRITEIASLGRLYAAACLALRRYIADSEVEHQQYQIKLDWLLDNLHSEDTYEQPGIRRLMGDQRRYNRQLFVYLRRCRKHIKNVWKDATFNGNIDNQVLHGHRQQLLKKLFAIHPR